MLYVGTHLLRRPKELRQLLVEGIAQAEVDANIPEVSVIKDYLRQLKKGTVDDDSEYVLKLIAHPPLEAPIHSDGSEHLLSKNRLNDLLRQLPSNTSKKGKVLLAIGPEGGWTDEEVRLFISKGYHCITFGNRILRTDMAVSVWNLRCSGIVILSLLLF